MRAVAREVGVPATTVRRWHEWAGMDMPEAFYRAVKTIPNPNPTQVRALAERLLPLLYRDGWVLGCEDGEWIHASDALDIAAHLRSHDCVHRVIPL